MIEAVLVAPNDRWNTSRSSSPAVMAIANDRACSREVWRELRQFVHHARASVSGASE